MKPPFRTFFLISTLGILLALISGCGQKHLHVSTTSGEPGQEGELEAGLQDSNSDQKGLGALALSESGLGNQTESSEATDQDGMGGDAQDPASQGRGVEKSEAMGQDDPLMAQDFSASEPGQEIQAQSSSQPAGASSQPNPDAAMPGGAGTQDSVPFAAFAPSATNESQSGGALLDEGSSSPLDNLDESLTPVERVPGNIAVAKAEQSDAAKDQLNRIREEEMATLAAGIQDVFFEFDSWAITQEGKQVLEKSADWLGDRPSATLLIEGHCDQRGTQAYNIVLGKKRAGAIRDYLIELGVDSSRLALISYGHDKPFCSDSTETCYQLNRRGHLLVQKP